MPTDNKWRLLEVRGNYDYYYYSMERRAGRHRLDAIGRELDNIRERLTGEKRMSELDAVWGKCESVLKTRAAAGDTIRRSVAAKEQELGVSKWRRGGRERTALLQEEIDGRLQAADDDQHDALKPLRAAAPDAAATDLAELDAVLFDALHSGDPSTPARWTEAKERDSFVQADIEGLSCADGEAYFQQMGKRGDSVGVYLAERHLRAKLTRLAATIIPPGVSPPREVIAALVMLPKLDAATTGRAVGRHRDGVDAVRSLLARIAAPLSDTEKRDEMRMLHVNVPDDWTLPAEHTAGQARRRTDADRGRDMEENRAALEQANAPAAQGEDL